MTQTTFFRLLKTPIDDKGDALAAQIAALNATGKAHETYVTDSTKFDFIPGSPFAYWIGNAMRNLFRVLKPFEHDDRFIKSGLKTADDKRFVRTWWEVPTRLLLPYVNGCDVQPCWIHLAKGGAHCPFYADLHLVVNWGARQAIAGTPWSDLGREEYYGRLGLTYPTRTTSGFSPRCLPRGCVFGHKGSSIFFPRDTILHILSGLAVCSSQCFEFLIKLGVGAADAAARSYEVGLIQKIPWPEIDELQGQVLASLAREAHDLQRNCDRADELTHAFCLPGLVQQQDAGSLLEASLALEAEAQAAQARLAAIQAEIDDIVFDLYGLSEADRALVRAEMGQHPISNTQSPIPNENDDEGDLTPPEDLPARVQNFLMWCVGVAFGRWDARMALDPTLLPALQGPFDPLPRCAPGTLVSTDGLPASKDNIASEAWLRARENVLDIPPFPLSDEEPSEQQNRKSEIGNPEIAWDGILVDDATHQADIVTRVREVLTLLWGDQADAIEREACDILGVNSLRDYFRDPRRGFFAFHIKRYSKSRRKAPIYWLLQSEKRNYAIWLYIHRLRPDALFAAGRDYADAKVALEQGRLEELRAGLDALSGAARHRREREIERQSNLVAEVTEFRNRLDTVALLKLPPDLNDGVVIGIAPLWELVPWKEAQWTWEKLIAGEYPWSTMAQRMRERGLVDDGKT